MNTSCAVWFEAPRQAGLRRQLVEEPGPGEVLVQVTLSAISAGTELLVYRGEVPLSLSPDLPSLEGDFRFPIKYGYATVGRVVRLGPGVEQLRPGDQPVFALHPHQSLFTARADQLVALPGLAPEDALFFANMETALTALLDAQPRLEERVVVLGQGVVGLLVTMLLRRAGAGRVLAVDPLPARREAALAVGANLALTPEQARPELLRQAGEDEFDLAIEVSGNPAALQAALDLVTFQGTVLALSWFGTRPVTLDLGSRFHRERLRLVSSQVGPLDPALTPRWNVARRARSVLRLLGELRPGRLISHRFPLARASEAYQLLDNGPLDALQVVLTYDLECLT